MDVTGADETRAIAVVRVVGTKREERKGEEVIGWNLGRKEGIEWEGSGKERRKEKGGPGGRK